MKIGHGCARIFFLAVFIREIRVPFLKEIDLIRILLVDQHRLLYPGIQAILAPIKEFRLLRPVATAGELRRFYQQGPTPDLLLYSPNVEGLSVGELFDETRTRWPSLKIAAILANPQEICARQLMAYGAAGVILKSDPPEQLVEAIDALLQGRVWISACLTPALIQSASTPEQTLSERELAVLQLLVAAKSNAEIAAMLKISERTVRSHLENVYGKLGVTTRVGAAVAAVRRKLVA
jgi:DNA-binding NarL/FixJ family response regulator